MCSTICNKHFVFTNTFEKVKNLVLVGRAFDLVLFQRLSLLGFFTALPILVTIVRSSEIDNPSVSSLYMQRIFFMKIDIGI